MSCTIEYAETVDDEFGSVLPNIIDPFNEEFWCVVSRADGRTRWRRIYLRTHATALPQASRGPFLGGNSEKAKENMTTETENKQLPARLEDVADVMLAETASGNPLLRFKKGEYFIGDDEIKVGHEYIAYPFDAMRGLVRWLDDAVVEQRLGRIAPISSTSNVKICQPMRIGNRNTFCRFKMPRPVKCAHSSPARSAARRRSIL